MMIRYRQDPREVLRIWWLKFLVKLMKVTLRVRG